MASLYSPREEDLIRVSSTSDVAVRQGRVLDVMCR